jgi:hypothetical protein
MMADVGSWYAIASRVTGAGAGSPKLNGSHPSVVIRPSANHHLSSFEAVEVLQLQTLIPEFCS